MERGIRATGRKMIGWSKYTRKETTGSKTILRVVQRSLATRTRAKEKVVRIMVADTAGGVNELISLIIIA